MAPPPVPLELKIVDPPGSRTAYYIVHFKGAIQSEWKQAVIDAGAVSTETYVPNNALVFRMTPKAFRGGYAQRNRLFENAGAGRFEDVTGSAGDAFDVKDVSRGAAFGDIDGDGDIDIVVVNKNSPARVLRNEGGERRPWLEGVG